MQAHKIALCLHSPTLVEIFSRYEGTEAFSVNLSDFKGDVGVLFQDCKKTKKILKTFYKQKVVMCVLHYVYTNELDLNPEIVGQVISCAGQLKMSQLLKACRDYLCDNLEVSTAILFFSIAANHNFKHIYDAAFGLIAENFLEISKSTHFFLLPLER